METRTIQKTGGSSYIFTLPKKWVSYWKLSDKSQLNCYIHPSGQLMVSPHHIRKSFSVNISADGIPKKHLERELIGLYISGADEIIINSSEITSDRRFFIRDVSHKFIGFELYESSSNQIILKNVSSEIVNIPDSIKRMLSILVSMYADIIKALDESNRDLAKDIIERDVEIDRIHLYIKRIFLTHLNNLISDENHNISLLDLGYYDISGVRLERIADHIVVMARTIRLLRLKEKIKLNKIEIGNINKITDYLNLLDKMILTVDVRVAHKLLDMYQTQAKNSFINKTFRSKKSMNILITDRVERIRSYTANIAEETINYSSTRGTIDYLP